MNLSSFSFCALSLAATFLIAWLVFPFAAMTPDEAIAAKTPIEAELLDDVSLPDFGDVSVLDMVMHYIDNPPEKSATAAPTVRFQGC